MRFKVLFVLFGLLSFVPKAKAALAIDIISTGTERTGLSTGGAASSNIFTTNLTNELVLAIIGMNPHVAGGPAPSVSAVAGGGLAWAKVIASTATNASSAIWRAFATSTLTSSSVTVNITFPTGSALNSAVISIITFSGTDTTGTSGSGAIGATKSVFSASGVPSGSLTTTRNNSLVVASLFNWTNATAPTVPAGQRSIVPFAGSTGEYFWGQTTTGLTSTSGTSVTINDTAPTAIEFAEAMAEVLSPSAGGVIVVPQRMNMGMGL